jgi:phage recombination protein Bet
MSKTELQTTGSKASAIQVTPATRELVKRTVFKGASDDELMLFFHKCFSCGVHPLSGKIFPMKFKDTKNGGYTIVFISSIDYFRSKAETTGLYDGQDEPVCGWENDEYTDEHPLKATVNIYKKEISRPFVGVAKWSEFYPKDAPPAKRALWDKMPTIMLAKCAEAQGFRKAFPDELNKLYEEAEMLQATEGNKRVTGNSTKPQLTQETAPAFFVDDVTVKTGNKNGKTWTKYGVTINGEIYSTFSGSYGKIATDCHKSRTPIVFTWEQSGQYKNLLTIEVAASQQSAEPAEVEDSESFASNIKALALQAGIDTETALNTVLKSEFDIDSIDLVPADLQNKIIDYFVLSIQGA